MTKSGKFVHPSWMNRAPSTISLRNLNTNSISKRTFSTVQQPEKDLLNKHKNALHVKDIDPNVIFEEEDLLPGQKPTLPFSERMTSLVKRLPAIIMHELHHYWDGTKQMGRDIKNAAKIWHRMKTGTKISRKERRVVMKAQKDIYALGSFIFFVIVPFMEVTLPFFLKVFPNMLPSPFIDKAQKEKNLLRTHNNRMKLSRLLQDTVYMQVIDKKKRTGIDFVAFMDKVRAGKPMSNAELNEFSKTFKEDFALSNLSKAHLIAMCKYMEVPTYGGAALMKMMLQQKFQKIKRDDLLIQEEGLDSLSVEELQVALRDRGMKGRIESQPILKRRLAEWLDLSVVHKLPITMLVLSRALMFTENEKYEETLQETLAYLTPNLVEEVIGSNLDANLEYLNQRAIELRAQKSKEEKEKAAREASAQKEQVTATPASSSPASSAPISEINPLKHTKRAFIAALDNLGTEVSHVDDRVGSKFHLLDTDTDRVVNTLELEKSINALKEKYSDEDVKRVLDKLEKDSILDKMSPQEILKFAAEQQFASKKNASPLN